MKREVRFGRYTIESSLGRGGMGEVYVARDDRMRRRVALKVLRHDDGDEDARARLLQEARAAAAFDHPNAVRIFDVDEVDGVAFLTMELLEGRTLRAVLREGQAPQATRVAWLVSIARTLRAAHARGIIHRDVKPENVMVLPDETVKMLDFGLARRVHVPADEGAATQRDGSGGAAVAKASSGIDGTLLYMSPEQLRDEPLDGAADQWSWGVVAYEALAGTPPWDAGAGGLALASQVLARSPEPLSARAADVSAAMDRVVLKALAKGRADRFADLGEAAEALERAANEEALGATVAQPKAARVEVTGARGRRRLGLAAGAGALVLIFVGLLVARAIHTAARAAGNGDAGASDAGRAADQGYVSTDPEALAAYREGLQAAKDGAAVAVVRERMAHAAERDPAFVSPLLRTLLTWENAEPAGRANYATLSGKRDRLSAHDRALFEAIEPWFRVPADHEEMRRRFARLTRAGEVPDADFALQRCFFLLKAGESTEALEACHAVQKIEPTLAAAYLGEGMALTALDDDDGASKAYARCLGLSPESTRCLGELAVRASRSSQCDEYVALTGRLVASSPNDEYAYRARAEALYAAAIKGGAEMVAYDAAVDGLIAHVYVDYRPEQRLVFREQRAIAVGDLDDALDAASELTKLMEARSNEDAIWGAFLDVIELSLEQGRTQAAERAARRWVSERAAWQPSGNRSSLIIPLGFLHRLGALPLETFRERRREWVASLARPLDASAWLDAYGRPSSSVEDAREALGSWPQSDRRRTWFPARNARALALLVTGDPTAALEALRPAVGLCNAFDDPVAYVRSFATLGDALRGVGDVPAACDAYEFVLARWGKSASVTASRARKARTELSCSK